MGRRSEASLTTKAVTSPQDERRKKMLTDTTLKDLAAEIYEKVKGEEVA